MLDPARCGDYVPIAVDRLRCLQRQGAADVVRVCRVHGGCTSGWDSTAIIWHSLVKWATTRHVEHLSQIRVPNITDTTTQSCMSVLYDYLRSQRMAALTVLPQFADW